MQNYDFTFCFVWVRVTLRKNTSEIFENKCVEELFGPKKGKSGRRMVKVVE
jgi:hypothetical protein